MSERLWLADGGSSRFQLEANCQIWEMKVALVEVWLNCGGEESV